MDQRWRTVRSQSLLKDQWIDLRAECCITPEGAEISPYYVLSYPDWVHVVAITTSGNLVLVRQYRQAAGEMILELPGGLVDPKDSSPENAARRELEEETGFTAPIWKPVISLYPNPATHTNRMHVFLASGAECTRPQNLDAGECGLQVELLDIPAVLRGLRSGLFAHAAHASAILLGLEAAGRVAFTAA
ncbi:MAG: NUDIX hydrolase [Acetobacteraceae bacterium]|nr:NUDIX hydrolase [Acetobacteraceae bacterium]